MSFLKKIIFIFFFFTTVLHAYSQGNGVNIDSIYKLIPGVPDTSKCKKLNFIARALGVNYPDSAFVIADSSRRLSTRIGFKKGEAYTYFLLGLILQNKGKLDQAINYYDKALSFYQKLDLKNDMSNIYNSLANIYGMMGKKEQAIQNFQMSFDLANKEPKSKYYLAISGCGLAGIKADQKLFDEAIKLNLTSIAYFKELGMMDYYALVLQNLSENYMGLKQYDQARIYNQEVLSIFESQNELYGLTHAYSTRASLYQLDGNIAKAIEYSKKAYDLTVQINALPEMAAKAKNLYSLFKSDKDYKNALAMLEDYLSYHDTLNNKEQGKAIIDAEAKFKNKQQEQQIQYKNLELEKSELKVTQRNNLIYVFIAATVIFIVLLFLVYKQFTEKKKANVLLENKNYEIEKQKAVIEEKNKDITDSINYSKHIQKAIIPSEQKVQQLFPASFVIFKPKAIVSGDFYLVEEVVGLSYIAVVDCTGHGVPGAMLSVFANSTIKNTISSNDFRENPAAILSDLCFQFKSNLQSQNVSIAINDGVDMGICIVDKKQNKLYFAGAKNTLILLRNNEINEYHGSRWGISGSNKSQQLFFSDHVIELQPGDKFYLCTDGFADQFGGPKGKKFKQKQLNDLLVNTSHLSFTEQKKELEKYFESWKGALEQIDDITLVGFSI